MKVFIVEDAPQTRQVGSGANFKKGRRADPGALGERESLACQIGPTFKLCTRTTCPWHGADFDLKTGAALGPPAQKGVPSYKVVVEGDDIKVEV